jgi:hypothetical protein
VYVGLTKMISNTIDTDMYPQTLWDPRSHIVPVVINGISTFLLDGLERGTWVDRGLDMRCINTGIPPPCSR